MICSLKPLSYSALMLGVLCSSQAFCMLKEKDSVPTTSAKKHPVDVPYSNEEYSLGYYGAHRHYGMKLDDVTSNRYTKGDYARPSYVLTEAGEQVDRLLWMSWVSQSNTWSQDEYDLYAQAHDKALRGYCYGILTHGIAACPDCFNHDSVSDFERNSPKLWAALGRTSAQLDGFRKQQEKKEATR